MPPRRRRAPAGEQLDAGELAGLEHPAGDLQQLAMLMLLLTDPAQPRQAE